MKRRAFITLLGCAVVSPLAARAQQARPARRVGVIMLYPEGDRQGQLRAIAFRQILERAGWTIGDNLQLDLRWGTGDAGWVDEAVAQALRLSPDVLIANGEPVARAATRLAPSVPIVFIGSGDPVADGLVQSLSHPGGNMTGFAIMEPSLGAKLLGLLKQIAPRATRVAVLINPDSRTQQHVLASLRSAPGYTVTVEPFPARDAGEIAAAMARLGNQSDYGLIVPADPSTNSQRKLIVELAARHRLPVVYALRAAVEEGGLMSYGVDLVELFRQAAIYADRILKGEKPANLPVQLPTQFEMAINMRTARALGLDISPSLLAIADEVIE